jgi:hypothetical protein
MAQLIPLDRCNQANQGARGRPLIRRGPVYAHRGYDFDKYRHVLYARNIATSIARRGQLHGSGLGKVRWVGKLPHAWLHHFCVSVPNVALISMTPFSNWIVP